MVTLATSRHRPAAPSSPATSCRCRAAFRRATPSRLREDGKVTPLPRVLNVNDYLDYITNRVVPDFSRVLVLGRRIGQVGLAARRLLPGVRASRVRGRHHRKEHDHAAGFHGPVDLQPEERDEVLQGISAARRRAGAYNTSAIASRHARSSVPWRASGGAPSAKAAGMSRGPSCSSAGGGGGERRRPGRRRHVAGSPRPGTPQRLLRGRL